MTEQPTSQTSKWNWMALWWFFVVSLCGVTIGAQSMGQRVVEMLSKAADRPDTRENVAMIPEQLDIVTNVGSFASIAALIVSAFPIPKFYGPVRKK